jgi:hypothetical protein
MKRCFALSKPKAWLVPDHTLNLEAILARTRTPFKFKAEN